jgi:general secretion pathway protein I
MSLVQRGQRAEGFTLIEVLVALTIAAVSLAIIFNVFSVALGSRMASKEYGQAILLAEAKLDSIGVEEPFREGNTVGRFDDQFWWKTIVTPYHEAGRDETRDWLRRPLLVAVTVFWDRPRGGSVTLTTLRLMAKEQKQANGS